MNFTSRSFHSSRFTLINLGALCCVALLSAIATSSIARGELTFNFTFIDDASGTFASRGWLNTNSLFQRNIRAAAALWGSRFDSNAVIVVDVDPFSFVAHAGGTNTLGRLLYQNSSGKKVWEFGPLTRILTGQNAGEVFYGYDIKLGFDAAFVESQYWFDPQPELRTMPVPANKGDFMSVALHEFGHGFGFTGYRDFPTGQILGNDATQFDDRTYFGGNGNPIASNGSRNPMFFRGSYSEALFGSDLHLTHQSAGQPNYSQNYYHLCACNTNNPDGLEGTLMNGCVLPNGERLYITPYELAVLKDIGYPLVTQLGDTDGDGDVDIDDYNRVQNNFGTSAVGDTDGDGDTDIDDYNNVQNHFGESIADGNGSLAAVPEPEAFVLLAAGVFIVACGRRSRLFRTTK